MRHDVLDGKAELLEQEVARGGSAESMHANDLSLLAYVVIPAKGQRDFDCNAAANLLRQHCFAIASL